MGSFCMVRSATLRAVSSACVVATAIAFDAVSGNARLNSSIGLPAILAKPSGKPGMLQCRHSRTQSLNVFFLHYVGNLRGAGRFRLGRAGRGLR